jgi:hypothetical protein
MIAELEQTYERIASLQKERDTLFLDLFRYATQNRDIKLLQWLAVEHRRFLALINTMNRTHKEAEDARAVELTSFDELHDYLVHALELEQLALREASVHEAYLRKTIDQMKAKKMTLGLK